MEPTVRGGEGDLAIRVEGIGKRYHLGSDKGGYELLSEKLERALTAPARLLRGGPRPEPQAEDEQTLWALRDVSFDLHRGEALGLIGRNGAGKSTLLKIMSRITPPTEGRIMEYGRVGSLLEVGTGFHPELTGRENVYLNGAIIGMRKREIQARFDEIVEFSGIERFLDTPVKRYSSGMYVRLAFAVAAHLEPEILIVDEVLAVGDAEFQRKCISKMKSVAHDGRAIVFVSHNVHLVEQLCTRVVLFDGGRMVAEGDPADVIANYFGRIDTDSAAGVAVIPDKVQRSGNGAARLRTVAMTNLEGSSLMGLRLGQAFRITAEFEVFEPILQAVFEVGVSTVDGQRVATMQTLDDGGTPVALSPGPMAVTVETDLTFLPGEYAIDVALHPISGHTADHVERTLRFTVHNVAEKGDDRYPWSQVRGYVRPQSTWSLDLNPLTERVESEVP